ncbi:MAG: hypothetical protein AB7G93_21635 [Bdellovibrionales bacterium]
MKTQLRIVYRELGEKLPLLSSSVVFGVLLMILRVSYATEAKDVRFNENDETHSNSLPSHHVYQNDFKKLGLAGLVYCGPAAVAESLAFLKWTRKPNFPHLKWPDAEASALESGEHMYTGTILLGEKIAPI